MNLSNSIYNDEVKLLDLINLKQNGFFFRFFIIKIPFLDEILKLIPNMILSFRFKFLMIDFI